LESWCWRFFPPYTKPFIKHCIYSSLPPRIHHCVFLFCVRALVAHYRSDLWSTSDSVMSQLETYNFIVFLYSEIIVKQCQ
jgi:hypothetical protein